MFRINYEELFELSSDAMLIIDDQQFVGCNQAAVEMWRSDNRRQLLAAHPSDLSPKFQPDGQLSFAKANKNIELAREQGDYRFEWVHRRLDGELFTVEVLLTAVPFQGRQLIHTVCRDITAMKEEESRLRLSRSILDAATEGVIVTDLTPAIVDVNPAYCQITGYSKDEVLGKNPGFTKSERHDKAFYKSMWQSIAEKGVWQGEVWDRRKSGEVFPKQVSIHSIRDDYGSIVNYVGIFSDISKSKAAEQRLEELAFQDPLTGLCNRAMFQLRLKQEVAAARSFGRGFALFYLDLDNFKRVNDTLGHAAGDELLVEVGKRISRVVRNNDVVARIGGDEFTVIVVGVDDAARAARLAGKISESVSRPIYLAGNSMQMEVSIGVAMCPQDSASDAELMQQADAAMYCAKRTAAGDAYEFFSSEMNQEDRRRQMLEAGLEHLINTRQGVLLHYQPQIDLASEQMIGVEALIRWQHPELGLLGPHEFIPVAEAGGQILQLGRLVLEIACSQVRDWYGNTGIWLKMAVNLSPLQLEDSGLPGFIVGLLNTYDIDPAMLELELTETAMMKDVGASIAVVQRLRDIGIKIAIDDFGTGYSSLSHLSRMPVDVLKIDRSFVCALSSLQDSSSSIVRAIVSLARALGLEVVAEGVESSVQLDVLRTLACDSVQGFYFSRPVAADIIERCFIREGELFTD